MQVGKTALCKGAQQVQGGSGLVVSLHQPLGVRNAAFFIKTDAIHDVAAIGRERYPIEGFIIGRARFGELAGHATDFNDRATRREGHDDGHLQ